MCGGGTQDHLDKKIRTINHKAKPRSDFQLECLLFVSGILPPLLEKADKNREGEDDKSLQCSAYARILCASQA